MAYEIIATVQRAKNSEGGQYAIKNGYWADYWQCCQNDNKILSLTDAEKIGRRCDEARRWIAENNRQLKNNPLLPSFDPYERERAAQKKIGVYNGY